MSAFFLYANDEKELDPAVVDYITPLLKHYSWVNTKSHTFEKLHLIHTAVKNAEMQIFQDHDKGLIFLLHGYIVESNDKLPKITDLPKQLIELYHMLGIEGVTGLNGLYNLLVWNPKENLLETANDRLGVFPIYYIPLNQDKFVLTTDIATAKSIPGYEPKISKRGLFDILYYGYAYEDRSILEGVVRLMPNCCYNIKEGKLTLKESLPIPFSKSRWSTIVPKLLDEFEHYFCQAIKRRVNPDENLLVFLSGGKDSRVFAHFLKKLGYKPECMSFGNGHHGDVFFAKQTCKLLGFPWTQMPISQDFYSKYSLPDLKSSSFCSRIHAPVSMEVLNNLNQPYDHILTNYIADDIFGETLDHAGVKDDTDTPENVFKSYIDGCRSQFYSDEELMQLFPKDGQYLLEEARDEAFQHFLTLGKEPYQMATVFEMRSSGRFKLGSIVKLINDGFSSRLPCLDIDMMDFFNSLPLSMLRSRLLFDRYLIERIPKLGGIPMEQTKTYYLSLVPSVKQHIRTRLWQHFNEKIVFPINSIVNPIATTPIYYYQTFDVRNRGFMQIQQQALDEVSCLEGLIDIDKAREILSKPAPENKNRIAQGEPLRTLITSVFTAKYFHGLS